MADPLPCPFCGSRALLDAEAPRLYYPRVQCSDERCEANGPWRMTARGAVLAWNRRALTPAGAPDK